MMVLRVVVRSSCLSGSSVVPSGRLSGVTLSLLRQCWELIQSCYDTLVVEAVYAEVRVAQLGN
jgi:hypothetical protein